MFTAGTALENRKAQFVVACAKLNWTPGELKNFYLKLYNLAVAHLHCAKPECKGLLGRQALFLAHSQPRAQR